MRDLQFFITGKRPPGLPIYADPGFIGDVDSLGVALYRKGVLEDLGYTEVEVYERPAPVKVE